MRKIYTFNDFLNEAKEPQDLNKIYLAYNPDLGHRFWSYKDFAADKFFVRLNPLAIIVAANETVSGKHKNLEIEKSTDGPFLTATFMEVISEFAQLSISSE